MAQDLHEDLFLACMAGAKTGREREKTRERRIVEKIEKSFWLPVCSLLFVMDHS